MILQALNEYYERKAADPDSDMAPAGWVRGSLDFLIEIDFDGNIHGVSDLREMVGKKPRAKPMDVPSIGNQSLKHNNSGQDANLLWDGTAFVFGLGDKGNLRLTSMLDAINSWMGETTDAGVIAVRRYLEKGLADRAHFNGALSHAEYGAVLQEGKARVSFRVSGTNYHVVFDAPAVREALKGSGNEVDEGEEAEVLGTCLITGEQGVPIADTHPVTKGVRDAQTSGAIIVSFNKASFESYGKAQSRNAPIGKVAAGQYGKALNTLLASPSQYMHIGDASTVFWSKKGSSFETAFSGFFSDPPQDDPDAGTKKIKALFDAINSGAYADAEEGNDEFYVLALAPNAARISVRSWQSGKVSEFAGRIKQHFDDFAIVKGPNEPEFYSVWRVLVNVATLDKKKNILPNIAGDFVRSILSGAPYPATLLQAAIRRLRSYPSGDNIRNGVLPIRAALVKAYLNRYYRFYPNQNHKEVTMALDITNPSAGYQLGRLFAALEKIQEEANGSASIAERFYGSACATPVVVFANLLKLKNHHLAKLPSKGRGVYFERLVGEILSGLNDFPSHLDLHEQGRFAIGYYHQRQAFFTKKEDSVIETKNTNEGDLENE